MKLFLSLVCAFAVTCFAAQAQTVQMKSKWRMPYVLGRTPFFAITHDSKTVITTPYDYDGTIQFVDPITGAKKQSWSAFESSDVEGIGASRGSDVFAATSRYAMRVWSMSDLRILREFEFSTPLNTSYPPEIAVSKTGAYVALLATNSPLRVFSVATGQEIYTSDDETTAAPVFLNAEHELLVGHAGDTGKRVKVIDVRGTYTIDSFVEGSA